MVNGWDVLNIPYLSEAVKVGEHSTGFFFKILDDKEWYIVSRTSYATKENITKLAKFIHNYPFTQELWDNYHQENPDDIVADNYLENNINSILWGLS